MPNNQSLWYLQKHNIYNTSYNVKQFETGSVIVNVTG